MTAEQFQKLQNSLEAMADSVTSKATELKDMGIKFRGTLAESCMFSKADREVVELNALLRSQYDRVQSELSTFNHLFQMMVGTLVAKVE